ncbi:MAG: HIT family protein [Candidatus Woesearchaeota archaeon]
MKCLFCNLKDKIIFENEDFFSIFDIHPVSVGHVLVISKEHVVSLLDLDSSKASSMLEAIKETLKVLKKTNFKEEYKYLIDKNISEKSVFLLRKC